MIGKIITKTGGLGRTVLLAAGISLAVAIPALSQVTPINLTPALTNNTTITNGATTLAGSTNVTVDIWQGRGLGFTFGAYATNAGQVTFYLNLSMDGTNYTDALAPIVFGNTLKASGWIVRSTNIPASVVDNYRYAKLTIVSNSADTVYLTNTLFSRRY
jgi:hypothetical protein